VTDLPQLGGDIFITDGGMETTLIFHQGLDLPEFASFVLLDDPADIEALGTYYRAYVELADRRSVGIVLDTPTWRANRDWGERLGYSAEALADANRRGVELLEELRDAGPRVLISGCVGPRGDGYRVGSAMSADEAEEYHAAQIETFADAGVDLVSPLTLTYASEATGIVGAGDRFGVPVVISFTVETDGRLPAVSRSAKRSRRWTPRRAGPRRTSWSTARTRRTSRTSWCQRRGWNGCAVSAPTPQRRATPSWTSRKSSTRATLPSSPEPTPSCANGCRA
jgi:S-methylmethionine-dependent homocysteine/selenocysteine methylase